MFPDSAKLKQKLILYHLASNTRKCVLYRLIKIFWFLIQTMPDLLHITSNKLKQDPNSCTNTCKHFTQLHHSDFILNKIFFRLVSSSNLTEQEFVFAVLTLRYVIINHASPTKKRQTRIGILSITDTYTTTVQINIQHIFFIQFYLFCSLEKKSVSNFCLMKN